MDKEEYIFLNKKYENAVTAIKAQLFDVISNEEKKAMRIGLEMSREGISEESYKKLQELAMKQGEDLGRVITLASKLSETLVRLDSYTKILRDLRKEKTSTEEAEKNVQATAAEVIVSINETDVSQQTKEKVIENVGAIAEATQVEVPEVAIAQSQIATTEQPVVEEAKTEEVAPTPVVEEAKTEEVAPAPVVEEAKTEEVASAPVVEEAPVTDVSAPLIPVVTENVGTEVVDATLTEESTAVVDTNDVVPLIPLPDEVAMPVETAQATPSGEVEVNTPEVVPEVTTVDKLTFTKNDNLNARALLTSTKQNSNLRKSLPTQEALYEARISGKGDATLESQLVANGLLPADVNTMKKQVEQLMEQTNVLYKDGKTAEAQAMYDKISELNKQIQEKSSTSLSV